MRGFTHRWWISNLQSAEREFVNRYKLKRFHVHQDNASVQLKSRRVHRLLASYITTHDDESAVCGGVEFIEVVC